MTAFNPSPAWPRVATTPPAGVGLSAQAGAGAGVKSGAFQQALADVQPPSKQMTVERGDTLIGMVKNHFRDNQTPITEGQAMRLALDVAKTNQLSNPNRIQPGQVFDMGALQRMATPLATTSTTTSPAWSAAQALAARSASLPTSGPVSNVGSADVPDAGATTTAPEITETAAPAQAAPTNGNRHPVLERTLGRAVDKGFVAPADLPAVRNKVVALAQRYNFAPDDFARLTLMESGGMNPQASNGSCHGIIQFCDGANRGAAAVGLKNNPRSILGMGLLQQLDLVDKYFSQAGLAPQGPKVSLDDLYLTVLTPAARQETRPNAPLPIAGPQARHLHVGGDARKPITRNSILSGLHAMTDSLLGLAQSKTPGSRWYADAAKTTPTTLR